MALIFTMALLPGALASRIRRATEETVDIADAEIGVNATPLKPTQDNEATTSFAFMTKNRHYPGHHAGFFDSIKESVVQTRPENNTKEEIVEGHYCQKRGERDETYYASSFCYWVPEYQYSKDEKTSGLSWSGGESFGAVSTLDKKGECVKYSFCHNNGRGKGGASKASGFIETLPVAKDCLKEKQIDTLCQDEFNAGDGKALKIPRDTCKEVQSRYDKAVANHNQCLGDMKALSNQIDQEIPDRIQKANDEISELESQIKKGNKTKGLARTWTLRGCNAIAAGYMAGDTPLEKLVAGYEGIKKPECKRADPSEDKETTKKHKTQYDICNGCSQVFDGISVVVDKAKQMDKKLKQAQQRLGELEKEKQDKQKELEDKTQKAPDLQSAQEAMEGEWDPQKDGCLSNIDKYDTGLAGAVNKCAPTYHDKSCELSCLKKQTSDGCGVVEGLHEGEIAGAAGVELQCMAPQPSWIMTPFTYGAKISDQCKYIKEHQKVEYAQKVLKQGWLWKKGRLTGGWKKRYFVLESGDEVRSAVLRYWTEDPSESEERGHKGIFLKDAKDIKEKDERKWQYNFKDGEKCFKLYHFYRDFRLCVAIGEGTDARTEREQWMKLIKENIGSKTK